MVGSLSASRAFRGLLTALRLPADGRAAALFCSGQSQGVPSLVGTDAAEPIRVSIVLGARWLNGMVLPDLLFHRQRDGIAVVRRRTSLYPYRVTTHHSNA